MSSPVSTPRCGSPLVSITSCVRQKRSIASATKPCDQALRARFDLRDAIAARALGLAQHARIGLGQRRVGEQRAGLRHLAAGQIDRGRGRPVVAEQLLDASRWSRSRARPAGWPCVGIGDRGRRARRRAAWCRSRAAAASRCRTCPGTQAASRPVPGTMSRPSAAVMRDGGAGRRRPLAADHLGLGRAARRRG